MLINVSSNSVPIISIQNDWEESAKKLNDTAWVSCAFKDGDSAQGQLTFVSSTPGTPAATASDGFTVEAVTNNSIQIRRTNTPFMCVFIAAFKTYSDIHDRNIVSLDVSEQGSGVTASFDKMKVFNLRDGHVRCTLSDHVADIYKCKWFPSGEVILSGGADMQIKIWSAETGKCAATLRGHTRAITDMAVIERGRNVISVSKDGTAKLWDCGKSACLADLTKVDSAIYCCSLSTAPSSLNLGSPSAPTSDREIGTENKLLLIGCEDGMIQCVAVHSRQVQFSTFTGNAINCCSFANDNQFIIGCQDGRILLYDLNELSSQSQTQSQHSFAWHDSNSPVLSLLVYKTYGFFAGHADGTTIFRSFKRNCITHLQLTGPLCDPIYSIVTDGNYVYTSTRDSILRVYSPSQYIVKFFDQIS